MLRFTCSRIDCDSAETKFCFQNLYCHFGTDCPAGLADFDDLAGLVVPVDFAALHIYCHCSFDLAIVAKTSLIDSDLTFPFENPESHTAGILTAGFDQCLVAYSQIPAVPEVFLF